MSPKNLVPLRKRVDVVFDSESLRKGQRIERSVYKLRRPQCLPLTRKAFITGWNEAFFQLRDFTVCDNEELECVKCFKRLCFPISAALGMVFFVGMLGMTVIVMVVVLPCDMVRWCVPADRLDGHFCCDPSFSQEPNQPTHEVDMPDKSCCYPVCCVDGLEEGQSAQEMREGACL